jgi:hypothetical protein
VSILALQFRENYALMGCDGVATEPSDGTVAGYVSKIALCPEYDCAIGITGVGGFEHIMRWFMPVQVATFDDVVQCLPDLVLHTHEHIKDNGLAVANDTRTNVTVAGWSLKRQAMEAYRVVTYPKDSFDREGVATRLQPFALHPMAMGQLWASAGPPSTTLAQFGLTEETMPEDADDLEMMTRMICAGRADSGRSCDDYPGPFNAGGFVQLALIQQGKVTSWISHRWPEDVIGEPIDPTRGEPLPEWIANARS